MSLLQVVKSILQNIIDQIDSGNCNMSDEEMFKTIDMLRQYANPEKSLVKIRFVVNLMLVELLLIIKLELENFLKERNKEDLKNCFELIKT